MKRASLFKSAESTVSTFVNNLTLQEIDTKANRILQTSKNTKCDMPFTGQRQHSLSTSGVSHTLQTQEVKSLTFFAP